MQKKINTNSTYSKLDKTRNSAFTLVEIIIVLAIIGVLLPIVFSILFTITRQQTKIYRLSEAKQQGDFVMAFMKSQIKDYGNKIYKDDTEIFEACSDSIAPDNSHISQDGLNFYVKKKDTDKGYVQFYTENFPTGDLSDTSNPKRAAAWGARAWPPKRKSRSRARSTPA